MLQNHGQLPVLPLVLMPDQQTSHGSTATIKQIEARHPEPAVQPSDAAARKLRERLMDSAWFTHTPRQTAIALETSFKDTLALLEPHFALRPFLFGTRPAFADFGLWGQLQSARRDPTHPAASWKSTHPMRAPSPPAQGTSR